MPGVSMGSRSMPEEQSGAAACCRLCRCVTIVGAEFFRVLASKNLALPAGRSLPGVPVSFEDFLLFLRAAHGHKQARLAATIVHACGYSTSTAPFIVLAEWTGVLSMYFSCCHFKYIPCSLFLVPIY
jgi:hypothetical protein